MMITTFRSFSGGSFHNEFVVEGSGESALVAFIPQTQPSVQFNKETYLLLRVNYGRHVDKIVRVLWPGNEMSGPWQFTIRIGLWNCQFLRDPTENVVYRDKVAHNLSHQVCYKTEVIVSCIVDMLKEMTPP